jgi:hypothetical protein
MQLPLIKNAGLVDLEEEKIQMKALTTSRKQQKMDVCCRFQLE